MEPGSHIDHGVSTITKDTNLQTAAFPLFLFILIFFFAIEQKVSIL